MSTVFLLITPLIGLVNVCSSTKSIDRLNFNIYLKSIALTYSILTLVISLYIFIAFHFSTNYFQFVQSAESVNYYNMSFGIDGTSIYFVLLTTTIMPVSLLSNWKSVTQNIKPFLAIILLLETLLLSIFLVLDGLLFYVFFESILPPLFILIGIFGSANRIKAGFYLFLYTLFGSLFMLLSILKISSLAGYTQYDAVYKSNIIYYLQLFLFAGIFIAFAVKTPTIFLNNWLLKAHVESPLSGSIILAGIVLKLSLYGIFRLMLPLLAKACTVSTKFVYTIGFITIIYGSASTIRTVDVKELIAYSSVCHAAVYLMGVFSNIITGIEGGIILGLAHGFVSSGLFICVGGVLYDRSSTRLISVYRGMAQVMPIFSILLFILCLGNCGVPLTLNFVGEFMSLYGVFERHVLFAPLASLSIILSAVYTMYLFNRIAFAGSYSKYFTANIADLNKREFYMLLTLVLFTVVFGIYPAPILDGLHYNTTTLLYKTPTINGGESYIMFYLLANTSSRGSYFFFIMVKLMSCVINLFSGKLALVIYFVKSIADLTPPKAHAFVSLPLQSGVNFCTAPVSVAVAVASLSIGVAPGYKVMTSLFDCGVNLLQEALAVNSQFDDLHLNYHDLLGSLANPLTGSFCLIGSYLPIMVLAMESLETVAPKMTIKEARREYERNKPRVDLVCVSLLMDAHGSPGSSAITGRLGLVCIDLHQPSGARLSTLFLNNGAGNMVIQHNGTLYNGIKFTSDPGNDLCKYYRYPPEIHNGSSGGWLRKPAELFMRQWDISSGGAPLLIRSTGEGRRQAFIRCISCYNGNNDTQIVFSNGTTTSARLSLRPVPMQSPDLTSPTHILQQQNQVVLPNNGARSSIGDHARDCLRRLGMDWSSRR